MIHTLLLCSLFDEYRPSQLYMVSVAYPYHHVAGIFFPAVTLYEVRELLHSGEVRGDLLESDGAGSFVTFGKWG